MERYGQGRVRMIVWLGPRAEWGAYEVVLRGSEFCCLAEVEGGGVVGYEMLVVARRG